MNWMDLADLRWKDLRKLDRSDILNRIGLEEHEPTSDLLTGVGLFTVGLLLGAGLGMIFAPKAGTEMRTQLTDTIKKTAGRVGYAQDSGGDASATTTATIPPPVTTRIS